MASVSAFLILGKTHPNDNGFSPEWVAELWEGDRAKWILRSRDASKRARSFSPSTPSKIFDSLLKVIEVAYPGALKQPSESNGLSLVVVCLDGSSLRKLLPRIRRIPKFDIHEAPVSWARTFDTWGEK